MCTSGPSGSGVGVGAGVLVGSIVAVGATVAAAVEATVGDAVAVATVVVGVIVGAVRAVALGVGCVSAAVTICPVGGTVTPPGVCVQATETVTTINSTATANAAAHVRTGKFRHTQ